MWTTSTFNTRCVYSPSAPPLSYALQKAPKRFVDHLSHKATTQNTIHNITKIPRPHYTKCSLVSRLPQASSIYKLLEFDNSTHPYRILEPYEFIEINISKSERQRIDETRRSSLSDPKIRHFSKLNLC